ncbi:MAG: alpha/beta hydrolase [Clostridium sartagoforme]|nr:alpha/beta hydrolase [Clostridium sartagoforme]
MRRYPIEFLDILKDETTEIISNGVKVILKPSPGEKRDGYLDPSEKAVMDEQLAARMSKEQEKTEEALSQDSLIQNIRDSMGFANLNLNTVEIYTKFETLTDSGNEVGLWRYYPRNIERTKNNPALVFFHGGGWIGGTTYVVENFCKLIAEKANCVVFNVDYSLAPEKPFPNGFNDNYCAVKHIYNNSEKYGIDKNKIAIAGDSAGGNYTATVALRARDERIPMIALQVLIYPCIALGDASVEGYKWTKEVFNIAPEQKELISNMIMLGKPSNIKEDPMMGSYILDSNEIYNPYVSPIMAESHENLPKAILVGAEFDGLRIQTEFYAKQLKDAGVDVTCYRYKGMTHAFIDKLGFVPQTEDLASIISEAILDLGK